MQDHSEHRLMPVAAGLTWLMMANGLNAGLVFLPRMRTPNAL